MVGPADYNSSPAGIADGQRRATALTRRARAGSAATSLVRLLRLAAAAWPGVSWPAPAAAALCHWQSRCLHKPGRCLSTGGPRSAGKKRQPTGPARNQHARGPESRPCAGQVASARPWAGAATCKRVETPSPASRLDRVRRRSGCNDSRPDRLSLQEGTCSGTNEAQQPAPCRGQQRLCRAMERVLKITKTRSLRSG